MTNMIWEWSDYEQMTDNSFKNLFRNISNDELLLNFSEGVYQ